MIDDACITSAQFAADLATAIPVIEQASTVLSICVFVCGVVLGAMWPCLFGRAILRRKSA